MENKNFIWAHFIQLGSNMWNEEGNTRGREHRSTPCASPVLRFNRELWDSHVQRLKDSGVNTLVIDIGEAMLYESHPELAVEGSFDRTRMKEEIKRLRDLGFELIPKLNFSACHDAWLKDYSRMLSTPIYYEVCRDLINEVCEVFKPKYFHLGMDEESEAYQKNFNISIVRQHDLWWHDLYFLLEQVERNNARAWVWSDYIWNHPDEYLMKMPKTVVQNNWYYGNDFSGESERARNILSCYDKLDQHGYDQVPTGSVFSYAENFELLTEYSKKHISKPHLLGMMQTVWERVDEGWMDRHRLAEQSIANAKRLFEEN